MGSLGPERKKRSPKTTNVRIILFRFDKTFGIDIYFLKPFLKETLAPPMKAGAGDTSPYPITPDSVSTSTAAWFLVSIRQREISQVFFNGTEMRNA